MPDAAALTEASRRKMVALVVLVAVYATGYLSLNRIVVVSPRIYDVRLPLDEAVPFVPALLLTYGLAYLMVAAVALMLRHPDETDRAIVAFGLMSVLQLLCFALIPVRMEDRPLLVPRGDFLNDVGAFWFWLAPPTNLFPSAHASMSMLAAVVALRHHPLTGRIMVGLALFVAVSVALVKQHYVADVLVGLCLAPAVDVFSGMLLKQWRRADRPSLSTRLVQALTRR
ncbi:MAG: phosphatase PAP2 family protein [Deltaproteobacteria bacterium]|nr:phosphatase PAP2 family protein [Deltaproteobacteria bacterium]